MKYTFLILSLLALNVSAQKVTIYGIGDSTMADKVKPNENPEHGWLQVFPNFMTNDAKIINKAVNGRSTKSFINQHRWDSIYKYLKKGDYVFIQFGHNDAKQEDSTRYTNPHTAYRHNLIKFVTEARQKGAIPILFSSIVRRHFNEQGTLISTHGEYTQEARLVSQEYKVPFIDLEYYTEQLEMSYGPEKSKELHLHFKQGDVAYYPEGKEDNTHLSKKGAEEVSKLVIAELKKLNILTEYIKK
ncbi:rhamnogalacturonan acetylesterase [Flavobacterium capsici]|uniref:Rhamnogalacturonan acetylesterase n=1 Tax=Flavobacterium capsici TaxID=3075618 RepID=A0AA96J7Y4_9FLAO|nr:MULTISPECIES: rhamnogalacturonan acetylesterase [unclassified Flavobacterium]WNM17758.1 rhamnogalacturonan acetylesterase [Flavobacterium sp. PMR2A8]WNM21811.1 rhamnogalacturonan acetylesterase [Flavobacterium sp. PMTSA4]